MTWRLTTSLAAVATHGTSDEGQRQGQGLNFLVDLEDFVHEHRPHGRLTADATPPAWNGYLLTVACPCGVVFGRWVTPLDAELDFGVARLN